MHFTSDADLSRKHFPTGRVSIEALIQFLIRDYDVKPLRDNWEEILAGNRKLFEKYRSWA
jgi:hypothetical protein